MEIVKDGDDILSLLLDHPQYKDQPGIVGTVMSNQGLAAYAHTKKQTVLPFICWR